MIQRVREEEMAVPEGGVRDTLDVTALIDRANIGAFHLRIIVLCAFVALLDGADTTSIAIAAAALAGKVAVQMSDFGVIFSAGTLGAMAGAMAFGPLADRFGRKRLLLVATVMFGAFTLLTAHAETYGSLMAFRFLAGLGLGGATPCFLALVSEYVPSRVRSTAVTVLFAAFPLGITLGGFLNSYLVAAFGWEAIFHVGGILPLLVAAVMAAVLPESPQFLIQRRKASIAAARIVRRLVPGADAARLAVASKQLAGVPVKHLFLEGRALATVLLWIPFFTAFGVLSVAVFFTPALLRTAGVPAAAAAGALVNAFHGLGALVGMAIAGRLVERYGAARALGTALLLGAGCTALLGFAVGSVPLAATATALVGLFLGIAGSGSIAVATLIYPPAIRATGIGWGIGMGRAGQVAGPLAASWLLVHADGRQMLLAMAAMLLASIIAVVLLGRSPSSAGVARPVLATDPDAPRPFELRRSSKH
jgi:AAHS family 4-hydroxybenzoate transporter-like MFS transporter